MVSRIDRRLGPKLPPRARYRVVLTTGGHRVISVHSHIDDAVRALDATHKPGFIAAGKRGRVRTSWGEWWLVDRLG